VDAIRRDPAPALRGHVSSYYGFREETGAPLQRREGPGADVVVILTLEHEWLIDGELHTSFVGGLREDQVTTEHPGRSYGMQINLSPLSAHALFGVPMNELAGRCVPFEELELVERLADARDWPARFALVDAWLARRLVDARPSPEIAWAWRRLRDSHGRVPVGSLANELGWSCKRIAARFREEVGLAPKAAAKLLRLERAVALAGTMPWAELAVECGYYDQSHLINEFRAVTGRTPETFLQDTAHAAA